MSVLYPDVPITPGVPVVLRSAAIAITAPVVALVADAVSIIGQFLGPQWGIFSQSGAPIAVADTVLAVQYNREARIADYPVENGTFASYNKVQTPWVMKMTFATGGSVAARAAFLAGVESYLASTAIVSAVTPEASYMLANVTHIDYRRESDRGSHLLSADVWVQQIRSTATQAFSNTSQPSGADPQSQGNVQTGAASMEQSQTAAGLLTNPVAGGAP